MKKILVVEDDEKILRALEFALTEEGYEVIRSDCGQSGLDNARSAKPDLILLDIMLPDINGFEVCRALKSDKAYKAIPIIMITALGDTENIVKGLSAGADDYVSKPFNLGELLARVRSHLRMKELYDVVKTEEEEKSAFLDVSRSLSATVSPYETLYTIVVKIAEIIEVKRCSIIYVDSGGGKGFVMASHDSKEIKHLEIDLNKYPEIQKVVETGKEVVINDVLSDPILSSYREVLGLLNIRSIMAFPITFKDSLIGTLVLRTSRREAPFNEREIRFCGVISLLAASPLRNAYVLEILQKEKEQEKDKRLAAQEYSQTLIGSSLDMIISADQDRCIVEFNHAAEETFGYKKEEVLGKKADILYGDPDEGKRISKVLREKGRFSGEIANKRRNGDIFPVFLSASVLKNSEGEFMGVMGVSRDITEMKRAEEELRSAKDNAEKATRLKDKFVSLVAHDLREPLGCLLSSLSYIRSNLADTSIDKNLKALMSTASNSGENMLRMIGDLLNLSRLKTGEIKPNYTFTDAYFLAMTAMSAFAQAASKKGIKMENKIMERTRIYADATLMYAVLQNLVSNAVKFCKEGDLITIFVPNGDHATIAVSDTGKGIDPERLEKLFSYEEKTSTRGTMGERGTGFGLPLSRDIMEGHGGELAVESTPGKGSIFYARLPHVRPKVLIVDDNENNRVLVAAFLEKEDVETLEAENGKEAMEIFEQTSPHLVITDIMMPVMDGFEVLRRLKDCPWKKSIPVIVTNSDCDLETRDRVFRMGADDFVVKPLIYEDLIARVRKILV